MKKFVHFALFFGFAFGLPSLLFSQKASAVMDTNVIYIGEQTKLQLNIEFSAADQVVFPVLKDSLAPFVRIVAVPGIDTSYAENTVTTKILSQELTITSFDSGYHPIPPILFKVNGDTVETQALLLTVKMVDIPQNADIKDIKNVLDVPFSIWDWLKLHKWYILSSILLLLLLILGWYYYKKYKNRPRTAEERNIPLQPAHEIALGKLEALRNKKLWENAQIKEYHVELSHIIREYLENRYATNSLDNTTDEIIYEARSLEMDEEARQKLAQVLMLADMAKFAKQNPVSFENEQSMKNAQAFINSTKIIRPEHEENKNIESREE